MVLRDLKETKIFFCVKVHNSVVGSLCNALTLNIWDRIKDRFRSLDQRWLTEDLCNRMAQSIGERLNIVNCVGAVDGKVQ